MPKNTHTFCCATSFLVTAMEANFHCPYGLTKTFIDLFAGAASIRHCVVQAENVYFCGVKLFLENNIKMSTFAD